MYRITGRVDDVLNVSGHRLGTAELENAINAHSCVSESAVVGYPHSIKGQGICAFVVADFGNRPVFERNKEVFDLVGKIIGPIARPDLLVFVPGLPKTRSGKIMRRILRKIAEEQSDSMGDISTLLEPDLVPILQTAFLNEKKGGD
jgi:acetyl-CoA synthetase